MSPADPEVSLKGKNIIVTGANTSLGFEAAVKFAALGTSEVILGIRDITKSDHANSTWNSYDSIRNFTKYASSLDRLVLNASVYKVAYEESRYGWEETLQVNVLSTAPIGLLLLQKMEASKTGNTLPVLEIVSSGNHEDATISAECRHADNLLQFYNTSNGYNAKEQYWVSKLFVMYVMQTLASLAKSSEAASGKPDVLVTVVCGGLPWWMQVWSQQRLQ